MDSQTTLYESLQAEFCPPLDSSLLTVLLADIHPDGNGNIQLPSSEKIQDLQSLLKELASQAECDEPEQRAGVRLSYESDSTPDLCAGDTTTSSDFSGSSGFHHSFSSPLGFLQAALPHIPTTKLNRAISDASGDVETDMEFIVEGLLTDEYLRELEERGVDGLDSDDDLIEDHDDSWQTVQTKKKTRNSLSNSHTGKRKTNKGRTFAIVDVRQKQHVRPSSYQNQWQREMPDPWTQISSLSMHVATLLPPHPPSFFQSFFHSPDHATPCEALRAALSSISVTTLTDPNESSVLFSLLDILLPEPKALDAEQRSQITSDAQLALRAAGGRGEDALDLVKLLLDLHSDSTEGYLQMGVYHTVPPTPTMETKPFPPFSLTATSEQKHKPPSPPSLNGKPSPFQWQVVPRRKIPTNHEPYPSTASIPTYNANHIQKKGMHVKGKGRGDGDGIGTGGKWDVGGLSLSEAHWCRRKVGENMRKRNELLREATRAWQKGNAKTRGGEVAYYFAERAREAQEEVRREALDAARGRVESKRITSPETVDLHGTTVVEAITIVKEILERTGASPHKPLTVITGRGTHSANKVSVLRPAVTSALVQDGWIVRTWDGGLTVRGKRDPISQTIRLMG